MEYNSQREHLIIPEYGRNIQKMVNYAKTIEDREKRNEAAKFIVSVMASMNQQNRDAGDYKQTLWDHLFIISKFELDVDSPYPKPAKETLTRKPDRVEYSDNKIRFRHYGKNIEAIIKKAIELRRRSRERRFDSCHCQPFEKIVPELEPRIGR